MVSRRTVLEETRAEQRQELVQNLEEGQVIDGVVKNITDYGAFVDLGGIDGLLHVTDIAWRRVNHPTEVLTIGQTVKVKIIKINHETHRISLGMKQLLDDPWQGIEAKYPLNARFTGRVTNITDYGAFVELEPGIEGLIHVSEMSWTKKNMHPGKIVSTSQEVEVQVLEVDSVKRRISLGLKQTMRNPWGSLRREVPGRLHGRRRGQEQNSLALEQVTVRYVSGLTMGATNPRAFAAHPVPDWWWDYWISPFANWVLGSMAFGLGCYLLLRNPGPLYPSPVVQGRDDLTEPEETSAPAIQAPIHGPAVPIAAPTPRPDYDPPRRAALAAFSPWANASNESIAGARASGTPSPMSGAASMRAAAAISSSRASAPARIRPVISVPAAIAASAARDPGISHSIRSSDASRSTWPRSSGSTSLTARHNSCPACGYRRPTLGTRS